jgi:ferredoxin
MDLDACIRCGRCQDICPAWLTEKPLSPKKLINALKAEMEESLTPVLSADILFHDRKGSFLRQVGDRRRALGLHQLRRLHGGLSGNGGASSADYGAAPARPSFHPVRRPLNWQMFLTILSAPQPAGRRSGRAGKLAAFSRGLFHQDY